ncbi:MAG: hypothetical protein AABY64_09570 [Bdellovibrionota bacterium]
MSAPLKQIKKGSVAKFREFYNKVVRKPLSPEDREELRDVFRKKNQSEQTETNKPKKIAKSDQDMGLT